ncbi:hypothetical protein [Parapedobacter tibetensis]|uniref:hypothetical protein n=1 Tax=Parapedobacter tibetensis TaxID=2972951 RepID=UPI00214D2463|nr:hypothetical protein [Parapedobacter tibetensis]
MSRKDKSKHHALLIHQGLAQSERLVQLNRMAIMQLRSLVVHSKSVGKLEEAKVMFKKEAIQSLNSAGILTKKGKFTKPYAELEKLVAAK